MKHKASCHCGAVRFEFEAPAAVDVTLCNCSICHRTGYQHVFIGHKDVTFLSGQDHLDTYSFGSHTAKHTFCPTCGVKPIYQPRSHADKYSINLRCVEAETLSIAQTIEFDGQNWEKNISDLQDKT